MPNQTTIENKETEVAIFRNTLLNSRFTLKNGKECIFLNGKYSTSVKAEIDELLEEIEAGNPHLYIEKESFIVAKSSLDPMAELKAKIIAEFKASQEAITKGDSQFGNYGTNANPTLNVANTKDVGAASAGSTSTDAAPAAGAKIVAGPR